MTIMTYAQAEHELTRVAARFEDWRRPSHLLLNPIPPSLDPAIARRARKGEFVACFDHFDLLQTAIN